MERACVYIHCFIFLLFSLSMLLSNFCIDILYLCKWRVFLYSNILQMESTFQRESLKWLVIISNTFNNSPSVQIISNIWYMTFSFLLPVLTPYSSMTYNQIVDEILPISCKHKSTPEKYLHINYLITPFIPFFSFSDSYVLNPVQSELESRKCSLHQKCPTAKWPAHLSLCESLGVGRVNRSVSLLGSYRTVTLKSQ